MIFFSAAAATSTGSLDTAFMAAANCAPNVAMLASAFGISGVDGAAGPVAVVPVSLLCLASMQLLQRRNFFFDSCFLL